MGSGRNGDVCLVADRPILSGNGVDCDIEELSGRCGRGREGLRRNGADWGVLTYCGDGGMFIWLNAAGEDIQIGEEVRGPKGVHCQGGPCEYVTLTQTYCDTGVVAIGASGSERDVRVLALGYDILQMPASGQQPRTY